ncbi:DUF4179 domain-containing protein [Bacillus sp. JJ1521]|uniref:DUF4179 domain-containing protein n=1 Tax=Bacillus sp. JJ1521 TaxID=3122957 RepID=UPI002FFE4C2E
MKKLYRQFNELKTDFEISPMNVDDLEKKRIKNAVLMKKKENKSIGKLSSAILIASSITIIGITTLTMTNPVIATKLPIIGDIFERFNNDDKEFVFDEYEQYSTKIGTSIESNGVEITITDAVYDGESVTIVYKMESEEDLGEEPFLEGQYFIKGYEKGHIPGRLMTERISDKEYAGLFIIYLMNGEQPDKIDVQWDGDAVRSEKLEKPLAGDWAFEFTLEAITSNEKKFKNHISQDEGIYVSLTQMVTTPISTTFYFRTEVDEHLKQLKEEKWEVVIFDYLVTDDVGNEYNVLPNGGYGDSPFRLNDRIITKTIEKEASYLTITPVVKIYKNANENRELELVREPYSLEPIKVDLKK